MSKNYITCSNCKNDLFEDQGIKRFANVNFQVLKCTNCGNYVNLETKSIKNNRISIKFEGKK